MQMVSMSAAIPPPRFASPSLTLTLLLAHDSVTEGEQAEKLVSV